MGSKGMHLFCFTYAGGAASFFDPLKPYLAPSIELAGLEYAGHGKRMKEPFYRDFGELADDMYPRICAVLDERQEPYALMGYSMGSISVVEILKKILEEGELPSPTHVFLAAHEPHTKSELQGFRSGELDDMVRERTVRFGGVPESLVNNRSFWRLYLPVYRADYSMIGGYDFADLDLRTEIPVTVFYSGEDTPLADMERWKRYFVGESEFIRFAGNHFFMQQHYQKIADIISERLFRYDDGRCITDSAILT